MEIETHFETRQEYIVVGNELASLEEKHKRDKEEAEKKKKELEEMMANMISNVNNVASANGVNPIYVPPKHDSKNTNISTKKIDSSKFNTNNYMVKPAEVSNMVKPLVEQDSITMLAINSNTTKAINNGNSFKNKNI